ncbi:MAG: DUF2125 domain-containing protein, partial [Dongiaceae bacterium]
MRNRWIIVAVAVLSLLAAAYTAYWFWAARLFERNLATWLDHQRAQGYRISFQGSKRAGFPLSVARQFSQVAFEPPPGAQSWQLRAKRLRVGILPWNPGILTIDRGAQDAEYEIDWGSGPGKRSFSILNTTGGAAIQLTGEGPASSIEFSYEPLLIFEDFASGQQRLAALHDVRGRIDLFADAASLLDASASFTMSIGSGSIDAAARIPLGPTLSQVSLDGKLMGSIPRGPIAEALAAWRDNGGAIELTNASVGWGPLFMTGNGTLALDQRLQPLAAGTARRRGYLAAIDALVAAG